MNEIDIAVIGAGPIGLAMARALAGLQQRTVLIDPASEDQLAQPGDDGREIALTHASRALLNQLGVWAHLPPADICPLRLAQVMDGNSSFALRFGADLMQTQDLGWLVPNAHLRRASWQAIQAQPNLSFQMGRTLEQVQCSRDGVVLQLSDDQLYRARLLVVADGRRSPTRQRLGVGAQMRQFGQQMLLCRMELEHAQPYTALEWFQYGQTLAILPLTQPLASVVMTLPPDDIEQLLSADENHFNQQVTELYQRRFGRMQLAGARHVSPLLVSYAQTFCCHRVALIGDAAVGMHPMTAHGYNFGLRSVARLVGQLRYALDAEQDIGNLARLAEYTRQHRLATYPLYQATVSIACLYERHTPAIRCVRAGLLRAAQWSKPFRHAVVAQLTAASAW